MFLLADRTLHPQQCGQASLKDTSLKLIFESKKSCSAVAELDSLAVVHSQHVVQPSSLWRLVVAAFYATFTVCICREHYSEAITQLAKSVVDPVQASAQCL